MEIFQRILVQRFSDIIEIFFFSCTTRSPKSIGRKKKGPVNKAALIGMVEYANTFRFWIDGCMACIAWKIIGRS